MCLFLWCSAKCLHFGSIWMSFILESWKSRYFQWKMKSRFLYSMLVNEILQILLVPSLLLWLFYYFSLVYWKQDETYEHEDLNIWLERQLYWKLITLYKILQTACEQWSDVAQVEADSLGFVGWREQDDAGCTRASATETGANGSNSGKYNGRSKRKSGGTVRETQVN